MTVLVGSAGNTFYAGQNTEQEVSIAYPEREMSEDEFIKTYIPNTNLSSISMLSGNTEINLDNIICSNGNVSMTAN